MKKNKKATSILEAMIVLLIIVTWILWLYKIYGNSQKLSLATKYRIEAIEIAREWIEAMKNIRDTNWIVFSWDKKNCYNTLNYNSNCVWDNNKTNWKYIENNKHYIIYKWNDNKWYLEEKNISWNYKYKNPNYRNNFRVYKNNWFYSQTWTTTNPTIYTREIKITNSTSSWFTFHSIVSWADNTKSWVYIIDLQNTLTNWKK
jgi:hypothetical protein